MTTQAMPDLSRVISLTEVSKRPMSDRKNDDATKIVTPFDRDDANTTYKWSEIKDRLGLSSNVANARWMPEKLLPLFSNLKAPALLSAQGKPTKFCAQWISRYKTFCNDDKNDYEIFAQQVKLAFADDAAKTVPVEVLGSDDDGYSSASSGVITKLQERVEEQEDNLASKIMLALQTKQQANQAIARYESLTSKSWEQEVIEDEIQKFQEEQEKKRKEMEIRAQVREMLTKQAEAEE